jgi:hypothetical protein
MGGSSELVAEVIWCCDGGVSLLRWRLVVLFAVEVLDLDVSLLPCNSFLGGGLVVVVVVNFRLLVVVNGVGWFIAI